jgi:hypothetical protein
MKKGTAKSSSLFHGVSFRNTHLPYEHERQFVFVGAPVKAV